MKKIDSMRLFFLLCFCFILNNSNAQTKNDLSDFPVNSGYLTSFDGTKIYYEVRGEGKPVVLVHGFIVNSNSWKGTALYKDLLKDGYQVIIMDMRGNDKSGKPHTAEAYAHDAEAKDIMALVDLLKINKYSVVGYSRGSIITARLLLKDKRIEDAVIGGIDTQFTNPEWPRRLMFYHALIADTVPELKAMVKYVQKQGLDQLALAYLQKEQPSATKEELHSIEQPVLVIRGTEDQYNPSAEDLSKILPNGAFAMVPGDHDHAYTSPEFSKDVISFLKKNNY